MTVQAAQEINQKCPSPLEGLSNVLSDDMAKVNALILKHMNSEVALIPQIATYLIAAGGKRLRPLLTLASARLCARSCSSRTVYRRWRSRLECLSGGGQGHPQFGGSAPRTDGSSRSRGLSPGRQRSLSELSRGRHSLVERLESRV